jgi:SAM-dependent methyltransferase
MVGFDEWYGAFSGARSAYARVLTAALGPGQYFGQQGLSGADEIIALARAAGAGPGAVLLDLCCGPGGPATLLAHSLGCAAIGLDRSSAALRLAGRRRDGKIQRVTGDAQQLPFRSASFDIVLLIDSLVSLPSPGRMLREVARVLRPGGRFGCAAQVGDPLRPADFGRLGPDVQVYLPPEPLLLRLIREAGLEPRLIEDQSRRKTAVAQGLACGLVEEQAALAEELGTAALDSLTVTISTWADLMAAGQIKDLIIVAARPGAEPARIEHSARPLETPSGGPLAGVSFPR